MQMFLILAVAVLPVCMTEHGHDGCSPDVFCGSLEDVGYCSNPAHCNQQKLWYHDAASGKCVPFNYYGTGGNYNRFYSKEQCEKTCIGYAKSYKYNQLCDKCPNPVYVNVTFDYDDLMDNGFFCNGNDCKCGTGEKCCPVVYGAVVEVDEELYESINFNGMACVPAVVGPCEKPYKDCSKDSSRRKRKQRYSSRRSHH